MITQEKVDESLENAVINGSEEGLLFDSELVASDMCDCDSTFEDEEHTELIPFIEDWQRRKWVMLMTELAKKIVDTCMIRGDFTLRSGQKSNVYFDKYRFMSDPELMYEVVRALRRRIINPCPDVLAGLETGGIPVATALQQLEHHTTGRASQVCFVRKKAKEYGTAQQIEGCDVSGQHVLVIEDVVTTGGAVFAAVKALREAGAVVTRVLCVIDRSNHTDTLDGLEAWTDAEMAFRGHDLELESLFNLRKLAPYMLEKQDVR